MFVSLGMPSIIVGHTAVRTRSEFQVDSIPGRSYLPKSNHVSFLKNIARYST